jgi:hypothetical protein
MARLRSTLALSLVLAGCGGGGGSAPAPGTREGWVVASMALPTTSAAARSSAFDLDGNGSPDNALGNLLAAVVQSSGVDLQSGADQAIATGAAVQLVETYTGGTTSVSFRSGTPGVSPCTNPQDVTTCGRQLDGSTAFTADAAIDPPLAGTGTADAFSAGPGAAHLVLPLFGGTPVTLPLLKARASFARSAGRLAGKIGGAVPLGEVNGKILPAMLVWIQAAIARDCPGGVCAAGSTGQTLLQIFDTDGDGAVKFAELQGNALLATLLAPDVDTDGNGTPDALSMGVSVELVGARF